MTTACGGDDTAAVDITLEFPAESAEARTSTVHLWVLGAAGDEPIGCTALMGDDTTPYNVEFRRFADQVFPFPVEGGIVGEGVAHGSAVVYLEAVDFLGGAHLAGCELIEVSGDSSVTLTLRTPGTFECDDPMVENGDPCDDGDPCTIGEECRSGSCSGGTERSCAEFSDECHSAACEADVGCVVKALPDLTSCSDDLTCTSGDVCMSGECVGAPTQCTTEVECYTAVCTEGFGCQTVPASNIDCDDGNECTDNDTCSSGFCQPGTPLSTGLCDDGDACTVNTTCGGDTPGVCGGGGYLDADDDGYAADGCGPGPYDCNDDVAEENPGGVEAGNCADGYDNDCDGFEDALDAVDCPPA